ncbi:polymorphic toxin-type HINT domain-containing protein [Thermogemmata fonticola]|uniref:polymorphic toxin-type HINT domain-containing protein n=1 Tax=Thermogemmata fonticola TaxID=2755323 RepID=UPI0028F4136B|nr:polymorphic toxin-type HINT domain-containing protein [Thermogemmata fonticola]
MRTTPEHPFYVEGKGWTPAGSLKAADRLLTLLGDSVPLSEVDDTGAWEVVYNLRVADYRTDFVGDDTWSFAAWAHNQICGVQETSGAHNPTYNRSHVDVPAITNPANAILQGERRARHMPPAGSPSDNCTCAYVQIVGEELSPIFASNTDRYTYNWPPVGTGAGQVPQGQGVNNGARHHAEIKAMIRVVQSGVSLQGKAIIIFTDRDPCQYCDRDRGIENAARILGATSVTIWCPSGCIGPIHL